MESDNSKKFAIKNIRKDKLVTNRSSIKSVHTEFQVLFEGNHVNLCNMNYFFTTQERFYFVMPLMVGGDLRVQLKKRKATANFNENEIKFYITQAIYLVSI